MSTNPSESELAVALERLAALLRSGLTGRQALVRWGEDVDAPLGPHLRDLGAGVALGQDSVVAIRSFVHILAGDALALAAVFSVQRRTGAAPARMIEGLAALVRERAAARAEVAAAVSGMRLSSRLVAGLPLAFVVLSPASTVPSDLLGGALVVGGIALGLLGFVWMGRITPRPPEALPVSAQVAGLVAAALRAGSSLAMALEEATAIAGRSAPRAPEPATLRAPWSLALRTDPDLVPLAGVLETARITGSPVAAALERFVEAARREQRSALDAALRKAPIAMVLPLVLCALPSFVLLAILPLVRTLALTT